MHSSGFVTEGRLVLQDAQDPFVKLSRARENSVFLEHLLSFCVKWGCQLEPVMRQALIHKIRNRNLQTALTEEAEQLSDCEDLWPLLTWARFEPLT